MPNAFLGPAHAPEPKVHPPHGEVVEGNPKIIKSKLWLLLVDMAQISVIFST
jgi:hypothetical protein